MILARHALNGSCYRLCSYGFGCRFPCIARSQLPSYVITATLAQTTAFGVGTWTSLRGSQRYVHEEASSQATASGADTWTSPRDSRQHVHRDASFNASNQQDQDFIRQSDIDTSYQALRQVALEGRLSQTRTYIDILIKERGQKPNSRLYNALLFANADHHIGSASEAAAIWEEMIHEGIIPSRETCHAVLRVHYMSQDPYSP